MTIERAEAETLTQLVAAALRDNGGKDTLDTLVSKCVDPETGYKPSRATVGRLARYEDAEGVKINPKLVGSLAAGLGISLERAQLAAAYQYIGYIPPYETTELDDGVVVFHDPGADPAAIEAAGETFRRSGDSENG